MFIERDRVQRGPSTFPHRATVEKIHVGQSALCEPCGVFTLIGQSEVGVSSGICHIHLAKGT